MPERITEGPPLRSRARLWVAGVAASLSAATLIVAGELVVRQSNAPSLNTGSHWSLTVSPDPGGDSELRSVTCASTTVCVGVGVSGGHGLPTTLVETWNGTSWSIAPSAGAGVDSWLNAVSCVAPSACLAVGGFSPTGDSDDPADHTLAERQVGSTWAVIPSPTPGNGDQSDLQSLTCPSANWCMAVGVYSPISNPYEADVQPLAETWNGTAWSVVAIPSLGGGRQGALQSVACTSPSFCIAVGSSTFVADRGGGAVHAIAEAWNGTRWSMIASLESSSNDLHAVACASARACMVVGSTAAAGQGGSRPIDTLAEWWDGTTWARLRGPQVVDAMQSALDSVTCTSASSCVAVGSYARAAQLDERQPLAATWDGRRWTITATPGADRELVSIACVSSAACVAVGRSGGGSSPEWTALVEVWQRGR